jgi:hypothetical protein
MLLEGLGQFKKNNILGLLKMLELKFQIIIGYLFLFFFPFVLLHNK